MAKTKTATMKPKPKKPTVYVLQRKSDGKFYAGDWNMFRDTPCVTVKLERAEKYETKGYKGTAFKGFQIVPVYLTLGKP